MIQMLQTYFETYVRPIQNDEGGQGLVEYALIIALVAVLLVAALTTLKNDIKGVFESIGNNI